MLNNQRGYTLIIVLLTITLISIFATFLIPKSLNTSLQVHKSEANAQAKDLAEMGVYYVIPIIKNIVQTTIEEGKEDDRLGAIDDFELFCILLEGNLQKLNIDPIPIAEDYSFQISLNEAIYKDVNDQITTSCKEFNTLDLFVDIIGKVDKNTVTEKVITLKGPIVNMGKIENCSLDTCEDIKDFNPTDPENLPKMTYGGNKAYAGGATTEEPYNVTYNNIRLNGGHTILIGGDAIFNGDITFNGSVGKIYIFGDAYFSKRIITNGGGNHICIKGKSFLKNADGTYRDYTEIVTDTKCPPIVWDAEEITHGLEDWIFLDDFDGELIISY